MAIDLLFVVLMPDASEQEPLTLLSRIVKVLRQPGVAEAIRQEIDPASIARRLMDAEQRFLQAKQGKA
jgi:mannitol/fructose-specific phosphotransferase system IIA component (Ntr-type)